MQSFNFLTIDLEEWFHILELPESSYPPNPEMLPFRSRYVVEQLLEVLEHYHTSCTFFTLGWLAERNPRIVRTIDALGHEIACHGYNHELIYQLGPHRFRQDIRRTKKILEDIIGREVKGYRGPGFSITRRNIWAIDIIAEEGFQYDATLYPGRHEHGGIPGMPGRPFLLVSSRGHRIEEYPVTLINICGFRMAFSGGGYFRLFPFFFVSAHIKRLNRKGIPCMLYLHPRDLDRDSPRLPMSFRRRFKCYVNLSRCYKKFRKVLSTHSFGSIRDWRDSKRHLLPLYSMKVLRTKG